MPPAIAAPGEEIVATFRAEGAQISNECKPGNDGKLAWVFRRSRSRPSFSTTRRSAAITRGQPGRHRDGSAVTGKAVGNAPGATANDIPWLKLETPPNDIP